MSLNAFLRHRRDMAGHARNISRLLSKAGAPRSSDMGKVAGERRCIAFVGRQMSDGFGVRAYSDHVYVYWHSRSAKRAERSSMLRTYLEAVIAHGYFIDIDHGDAVCVKPTDSKVG